MSSRSGMARRGGIGKPTAEVTHTHTIHARTSIASKWHEVTVTHPDGTVQYLSINATEFPTRTAAKAEAIRRAVASKPTYEQEYAKARTTDGHVATVRDNEHLAAVARSEGRTALAEAHDRLATALRDNGAARAQAVVMGKGRSKAALAARAEAEDGMRRTQREIDALEQRLAFLRTAGAQAASKSARAGAGNTRAPTSHAGQMKVVQTEYQKLAARFATDVHGQNRRNTFNDARELAHRAYDVIRAAQARMHTALDREDNATTAKERASAKRAQATAQKQQNEAQALWETVYGLSAAARNNQETTDRWLTEYKKAKKSA